MLEPGQILQPADTGTVHDEPHGGELHPHPVPLQLLAGVFGALIALTVATVAVTYVDLGSMNLVSAGGGDLHAFAMGQAVSSVCVVECGVFCGVVYRDLVAGYWGLFRGHDSGVWAGGGAVETEGLDVTTPAATPQRIKREDPAKGVVTSSPSVFTAALPWEGFVLEGVGIALGARSLAALGISLAR